MDLLLSLESLIISNQNVGWASAKLPQEPQENWIKLRLIALLLCQQ